ncbi:MAG: hypothetical protein NZM31_12400, partial [Gemmatales bacterium]|nr:hypothetical protein [Gemmatales bacterium]MDW8387795.1 hypothetical protein [Gemmatales bacterium]
RVIPCIVKINDVSKIVVADVEPFTPRDRAMIVTAQASATRLAGRLTLGALNTVLRIATGLGDLAEGTTSVVWGLGGGGGLTAAVGSPDEAAPPLGQHHKEGLYQG